MLATGRCAVSALPRDRFALDRFYHPRKSEPGFSYTFAAGVLDDPFAFDPSVFGISPREAEQIDPQQRLLLELVWEALEDAGIAPSSTSGKEIGVFAGASGLDYGARQMADPALIDAHFMAGNTLSNISNRISYIYNWHGPSFTVDTACSSSMVALHQAVQALELGTIDMAVVAGVNLLASPSPFIGFSRASMLSPTGLCRPFSAEADGYVRAEGGVVLLLERADTNGAAPRRVRGEIIGTAVNSDGRTAGLTLPSGEAQRRLLEDLYGDREIDPKVLSFVEAHGTGTRVGDPAEAFAIGKALGQSRTAALPVGSIKSNIGHLEPASGLAGILKSLLAFEHGVLPPSLHLDAPNPDIDFEDLNLAPAKDAVALAPANGRLYAGVSSFGFGGTNAHAVLRGPARAIPAETTGNARLLMFSAQSQEALAALAGRYAEAVETGVTPGLLAGAAARGRDLLPARLALPLAEGMPVAAALRGFATGEATPSAVAAKCTGKDRKVAFVYSGNGAQFAGMGRAAFATSATFRDRFRAIDALLSPLSGWSLEEKLADPDLTEALQMTSVAQPLLFAIQSSLTHALAEAGLVPDCVFGHSVGEVAAAEASGALTLENAVRLIHWRSVHQEAARGLGAMAVLMLDEPGTRAFLADHDLEEIDVAACNGPRSTTVSGTEAAIRQALQVARKRRVVGRRLDLDYPFHSRLLAGLETPLTAALTNVTPGATAIPFISTVTGGVLDGRDLDARYWWRNVRDPVRFGEAAAAALARNCGVFLEIGPKPIMTGNLTEILSAAGTDGAVLATLDQNDEQGLDPVARAVARVVVHGGIVDARTVFGDASTNLIDLPTYPWQHRTFTIPVSNEAVDNWGIRPRHPLIGGRVTDGQLEWRTFLDASVVPYLADHRIDGDVVVPGTGLLEMVLAAGREWLGDGPLMVEDFDILRALMLPDDGMREVAVRISAETKTVEILSRRRLGEQEWSLHAKGRVSRPRRAAQAAPKVPPGGHAYDIADIYERARRSGLGYGPEFRRVRSARRIGSLIDIDLLPPPEGNGLAALPHILHPAVSDATLHPIFMAYDPVYKGARRAYLPERFGVACIYQPGVPSARATIRIDRQTDRSIVISATFLAGDGSVVATFEDARSRSVFLARSNDSNVFFRTVVEPVAGSGAPLGIRTGIDGLLSVQPAPTGPREDWLLLSAFARALTHETFADIADGRRLVLDDLVASGRLAAQSVPMASSLLSGMAAAGLATETTEGWMLAAESGLPPSDIILRTLIADHPSRSVETLMAATVSRALAGHLATGEPIAYRAALIEQFETVSLFVGPGLDIIRDVVNELADRLEPGVLNILISEPGALGIIRALSPLVDAGKASLTIVGTDQKKLASLEMRLSRTTGIQFVTLGQDGVDLGSQTRFHIGIMNGLRALPAMALAEAMTHAVADGGAILALQPEPDHVLDFLMGATADWFAGSAVPNLPVGPLATAAECASFLQAAGLTDVVSRPIAASLPALTILTGTPARHEHTAAAEPASPVVVFCDRSGRMDHLGTPLADAFLRRGRHVSHVTPPVEGNALVLRTTPIAADDAAAWQELISGQPGTAADGPVAVIHVADIAPRNPAHSIENRIMTAAALLEGARASERPVQVWLVTRGAAPDLDDPATCDPAGAGLWAFGRVACNEYPDVDIRLLDVAPDLSVPDAVRSLAELVARPRSETELLLKSDGLHAVRAKRGLPPPARTARDSDKGLRLDFLTPGSFDHLIWREIDRVAPGEDEVEVAVEASGLNFRDVMFAMGVLTDEVLEHGFTGPVLGFECAGRVERVGEGVKHIKPGDRVMTFAPGAFGTHVTVPGSVVAPVPGGLTAEAAATIPVAFLTAWYSLMHLARLKRGETVLIHGAAGGVGLAAMQIAHWRGARVIATAGADDKRALVDLLGAEMVLDSRSLAFADEIRERLGGVDVVLNSLYGDAMEASLKALKPFGRFIELGKRDYVQNTSLGLRPFRRNLTYFGVDVDQLLLHDAKLASRLFKDISDKFAAGRFSPLPFRAFESEEAGAAMRLMQSAGHIGKIVVRPPANAFATSAAVRPFKASPNGVHVVAGGTGGFGFEAARWLARNGARRIVVASRQGRLKPEAEAAAKALRESGVQLWVEPVDLAQPASVQTLVRRIEERCGEIAGVIHAAMVLDDGLIKSLDRQRIAAVLAPKVAGALNLELALRGRDLDYFVFFSSATTLVGNPGQASYVAANGFMEGLARRRRAAGLPALAVAWGAIADAGVLARDAEKSGKLAKRIGRTGLSAENALDHLGQLLSQKDGDGVAVCAKIDWSLATQELKVLKSPTFADLAQRRTAEAGSESLDLARMIEGRSDVEARAIVADVVAAQVGRILRLPAAEIDPKRPLSELGMDSLMGLELRMSFEEQFGLELPIVALSAGRSLNDVATRIVAELRGGAGETTEPAHESAAELARRHGVDADVPVDLSIVAETAMAPERQERRLAQ